MQVNFDLAPLSECDIQQFLDLLDGESPSSRTIVDVLLQEKHRCLTDGEPVRSVLLPIAEGVAVSIVEEKDRCADPKRENN